MEASETIKNALIREIKEEIGIDITHNKKELIDLFKGLEVKINLIPFNWWEGSPFEAPSNNAVHRFAKVLEDAYLAAPIRTPRGQDIMAACGQLKSAYKNNKA